MDDTRDIAINAQASAASAHHRLDKMNGSIDRLGDETEELRRETTAGFVKLTDDLAHGLLGIVREAGDTKNEVTAIKTTVWNALKVMSAFAALVTAITAGVTVYAITHMHVRVQQPPALPANTK